MAVNELVPAGWLPWFEHVFGLLAEVVSSLAQRQPTALLIAGIVMGTFIGWMASRSNRRFRIDRGARAATRLIETSVRNVQDATPLGEPDLRAAAAMLNMPHLAVLVNEPTRPHDEPWGELHLLDGQSYTVHRVPLQTEAEDLGCVPPAGLRLPRPYRVKTLYGMTGEMGKLVLGPLGDGSAGESADTLLALLGAWWSLRLENRRLAAEAESRLLDMVESLITSVEAKDPYTSGHSKRVCSYSELIAREMGLVGHDLEEIAIGAALHDVGKLGIPEHVLRKPSKLDDDEWQQMKSHPRVGARIIDSFNQSQVILDTIYHHHEHFNGRGYPRGLAGSAIPLPARIVGAADALDAMTSARSYQRNRTIPDALEEIKRNAGTQFDPAVVQALLRIPVAALQEIAPNVPAAEPPVAVPAVFIPSPVLAPAQAPVAVGV